MRVEVRDDRKVLGCSSQRDGSSISWDLEFGSRINFLFLSFFLFFFLTALGLRCCAWAFSSCGKRGATLRCSERASHHGGFSCCGAWALGTRASVVAARGLSSCGAWALE